MLSDEWLSRYTHLRNLTQNFDVIFVNIMEERMNEQTYKWKDKNYKPHGINAGDIIILLKLPECLTTKLFASLTLSLLDIPVKFWVVYIFARNFQKHLSARYSINVKINSWKKVVNSNSNQRNRQGGYLTIIKCQVKTFLWGFWPGKTQTGLLS